MARHRAPAGFMQVRYGSRMSAHPTGQCESYEAPEEAEIEAILAAHDQWVAAGCSGARSHEEVMAELLGSELI